MNGLLKKAKKRKNRSVSKLPPSIKNHRLAWLMKSIWHRPHSYNKMYSAVVCAEPGSGKSWLTLSLAEQLDRGSNDVGRFSLDRVYFSAAEFAAGMAKKWPKGTVHVFDDAGLNLFSREAMQKSVRDVVKIFQSVRYKNYIIFLSLPAFNMMDKAVRQLTSAYIEPIGIDFDTEKCEAKYNLLQTNPHSGDIYRHRPETLKQHRHSMLNYGFFNRSQMLSLWFDRPSHELTEPYEKKKAEFMGNYFRRVAREIGERSNGSVKVTMFEKYYNLCKDNLDQLWGLEAKTDAIVPAAIISIYPACGMETAKRIATVFNYQHKKGILDKSHLNAHQIATKPL